IADFRAGRLAGTQSIVEFSVSDQDNEQFRLRIESGPHKGEEYRMDRKVDFGFDQLSPPGYASIPLRVEGMNVRGGNYRMFMGIDCSRDLEVDMEESRYYGPNPTCK